MMNVMGNTWAKLAIVHSRPTQFVHMIHAEVLGYVQLPKMEAPVFAVCDGRERGTPCSYTAKIDPRFDHGIDSGLIQGACDLHDENHTAMMCLAASLAGSARNDNGKNDEGSPIILTIAVAAAALLVGSVAGICGVRITQRSMQQKNLAAASKLADVHPSQMAPVGCSDEHPSQMAPIGSSSHKELPSEASSKESRQPLHAIGQV